MSNETAYERALQQVERQPDGSIDQEKLIDAIVANLEFDFDAAKRGQAKRIIADKKRSGRTPAEGQLVLPIIELAPYAYEPQRLVADHDGNVIENAKARPAHKEAEAERAKKQAAKAEARFERRKAESDIYAEWAQAQATQGRPEKEITWDTCIHEVHLWKDEDAEPEPNVDDEEST